MKYEPEELACYQVAKMYSKGWRYVCPDCDATGLRPNKDLDQPKQSIICSTCGGSGMVP